LHISWVEGSCEIDCYILPHSKQDIILGRTFFQEAGVYPDILKGGWISKDDLDFVHPFDKRDNIFASKIDHSKFAKTACADIPADVYPPTARQDIGQSGRTNRR
jgi:hypothetical protein